MKVLHVPYTYHPHAVGGTEIYVEGLARAQQAAGMEPVIVAPGDRESVAVIGGIRVLRFPVSQTVADIREMYGEGDVAAAEAFARVLEGEQPDVVHVHAFTRGVSLRLVRAAKRAGKPVIFSYHTPTVSCQRGTLLKWGSEICDGVLDARTCAECNLQSRGLTRLASSVVGSLSGAIGGIAASTSASGGLWTALRMRELMELRHHTFRSLMDETDHIVALAEWVQELLLRNGVPAGKITVSRQGLGASGRATSRGASAAHKPGDPLRMIFLGRLDPVKGVGVVVEALRMLPNVAIQFDIHGVAQGEGGIEYLGKLRSQASGDPRISFHKPVAPDAVVARIREFDLLVAPSQTLETGPMVVLEAFTAGVPVAGSDLGGIRETIAHNGGGLLVRPFDSPGSWAQAIRSMVEDPGLLGRLRNEIRPPRDMTVCADEMAAIYRTFSRANACV